MDTAVNEGPGKYQMSAKWEQHAHQAILNEHGNGESTRELNHTHIIENWEVQALDGHSHQLEYKLTESQSETKASLTEMRLDDGEAGDIVQWAIPVDGIFHPSPEVTPQLPPGYYSMCQSMNGPFFKAKGRKQDEALMRFPDADSDKVIQEIDKFWTLEERFKQDKLPFKRGMMLFGPPGSGKTCTLRIVVENLVTKNKGIVVDFPGVGTFLECYKMLRAIHPEMPLIVLMEDIDAILRRSCESEVLNLLDGMHDITKTIFVATTNYPEQLGSRIMNRPSRFDRKFLIGMPSAEAREMFIRSKLKNLDETTEEEIKRWVKDTEGMSIAHIKELYIATKILGDTYEEAIGTLDAMRVTPASGSFDDYRVVEKAEEPKRVRFLSQKDLFGTGQVYESLKKKPLNESSACEHNTDARQVVTLRVELTEGGARTLIGLMTHRQFKKTINALPKALPDPKELQEVIDLIEKLTGVRMRQAKNVLTSRAEDEGMLMAPLTEETAGTSSLDVSPGHVESLEEAFKIVKEFKHLHEQAMLDQQPETLDDVLDNIIRKMIVVGSLDALQDVDFDEETNSIYLFMDASITFEETRALQEAINSLYQGTMITASPEGDIPEGSEPADWWVLFVPQESIAGIQGVPQPPMWGAQPTAPVPSYVPADAVADIAQGVDVNKAVDTMLKGESVEAGIGENIYAIASEVKKGGVSALEVAAREGFSYRDPAGGEIKGGVIYNHFWKHPGGRGRAGIYVGWDSVEKKWNIFSEKEFKKLKESLKEGSWDHDWIMKNQPEWTTVKAPDGNRVEVLRVKDSRFVGAPSSGRRNSKFFDVIDLETRTLVTRLKKDEVRGWLVRSHWDFEASPDKMRWRPIESVEERDLKEPTARQLDHELTRISTMKPTQLLTRLGKIKNPQKLFAFMQTLDFAASDTDDREERDFYRMLSKRAKKTLHQMGYSRTGRYFRVSEARRHKAMSKAITMQAIDELGPLFQTEFNGDKKLLNAIVAWNMASASGAAASWERRAEDAARNAGVSKSAKELLQIYRRARGFESVEEGVKYDDMVASSNFQDMIQSMVEAQLARSEIYASRLLSIIVDMALADDTPEDPIGTIDSFLERHGDSIFAFYRALVRDRESNALDDVTVRQALETGAGAELLSTWKNESVAERFYLSNQGHQGETKVITVGGQATEDVGIALLDGVMKVMGTRFRKSGVPGVLETMPNFKDGYVTVSFTETREMEMIIFQVSEKTVGLFDKIKGAVEKAIAGTTLEIKSVNVISNTR